MRHAITLENALLAAAVLGARPSAAQAQSVMGQVLDSATRRPVAGLTVRLRRVTPAASADTAPVGETVTRPDGVFALTAPDSGDYQVHLGAGFAGPVLRLTRDSDDQRLYVLPAGPAAAEPAADRVYGEREVTRPARWRAGTGNQIDMRVVLDRSSMVNRSRLPAQGRTHYLAVVDVVVTAHGRAEPGSARLVSTTDALYGDMAVQQVATSRFEPAMVDGRPVRQLLRVPVRNEIRTAVRVVRVEGVGP